jgi:hypothetical protein
MPFILLKWQFASALMSLSFPHIYGECRCFGQYGKSVSAAADQERNRLFDLAGDENQRCVLGCSRTLRFAGRR